MLIDAVETVLLPVSAVKPLEMGSYSAWRAFRKYFHVLVILSRVGVFLGWKSTFLFNIAVVGTLINIQHE